MGLGRRSEAGLWLDRIELESDGAGPAEVVSAQRETARQACTVPVDRADNEWREAGLPPRHRRQRRLDRAERSASLGQGPAGSPETAAARGWSPRAPPPTAHPARRRHRAGRAAHRGPPVDQADQSARRRSEVTPGCRPVRLASASRARRSSWRPGRRDAGMRAVAAVPRRTGRGRPRDLRVSRAGRRRCSPCRSSTRRSCRPGL